MKALVCGSSGFIGTHLVKRLRQEGYEVHGFDIVSPLYGAPDHFCFYDLRREIWPTETWDEVYQLAANMGGAEFIFTGENDAAIMRESALININVLEACRQAKVGRVFFSSSACIYPQALQGFPEAGPLAEFEAYPADPDSCYGWEKLFSERLYDAYSRNHGISVRTARLHNVFGPLGTWRGGREKAPAAICRKVAESLDGDIEVFGDGCQTRSFLYIDECIEGIRRLMASDVSEPVNLGSSETISINGLVEMVAEIAGRRIEIRHVDGPQGVRGRCSDNTLIKKKLGWAPSAPLRDGLEKTYAWIASQVALDNEKGPL